MATSFIRISSEAGWPDNPIKCLVWLRAVWTNTGLFQHCVCLSVYVEISMNLCQAAMVCSQSPMVLLQSLKEQMTLIIFKFADIYSSKNHLFNVLFFCIFQHTITPLYIWFLAINGIPYWF